MADYINPPIETDPEVLADIAFQSLQAAIPGWAPADGNLDTITLEAKALIAAEVRDIASRVPSSIFRYFGQSLVRLPAQEATYAEATVTFTAVDTAGYNIPLGTLVGLRDPQGNLISFETANEVTIPFGSSTASVDIRAVVPGETGSGLGGPGGAVELLDPLAFIDHVTQDSMTILGVDAEEEVAYLNRLALRLQLLSSRIILPYDAGIFARDVAGVHRALVLDLYNPGKNEIQRVTITGAPTGGTFTLTWNGQGPTAGIAYNATAAVVRAALEALSNIDVGDIVVTGGPLPGADIFVEFVGPKGFADQPQMTASGAGLTGGTTPAVALATTQAGGGAAINQERYLTVVPVDAAGEPLSATTREELRQYLDSQREVSFILNIIDPTYNKIDVTVQVRALPGYDPVTVADEVHDAIVAYLSPARWGTDESIQDQGSDQTWVQESTVRYLEVAQVINNVEGVYYIVPGQFTMGLDGGALAATDVSLVGTAPLTRPDTITVTATS